MAPNTSRVLAHQEQSLILIAAAYLALKNKKKLKRKHRWWVHDLLKRRHEQGAYHNLVQELAIDGEKFQQYMRLNREQFAYVLELVEETLTKYSRFREVICPRQRLAVCLRFLATGESFHSLAFSYRLGVKTVGSIVKEVCAVLWDKLAPIHMKFPSTEEEWKVISANFSAKWQFPHCLGAVDGKHVVMMCPDKTGSLYFNYKGTFSIVLIALVDANLRFIAIDVGAYGRNSDGGIFANSNLGKAIANETINLPQDEVLPQADHLGPVPYVIIGDEAFPLQRHIMRPYPGRGCSHDEHIFNYRLSRARRIVENAFGILAVRWRLYHSKLDVQAETAKQIVKATCVLHNLLQSDTTPAQATNLLQDSVPERLEGLQNLAGVGHRGAAQVLQTREIFKEYLNNVAPVPWQETHVRRGQF